MDITDNICYEWAKEKIDINLVIEHYKKYHKAVENYLDYIKKENSARSDLIQYLKNRNFSSDDIENLVFQYEGTIQNIYFELGLKIGAQLGARHLLKDNI